MGGSDIKGTTPGVMDAFESVDTEVSVDVIVGPGFQNLDSIRQVAKETETRFTLYEDPENFPEIISRADLAVSAAGSTTYELLAVGTPTIAIPQADNQEPIARALAERDAVRRHDPDDLDTLGVEIEALLADAESRHDLRRRGRDLVDCRGTERIYRSVCEPQV
jgi:spore coat polysaccharide biosynthesis predicted glycosyltransferase SpsG